MTRCPFCSTDLAEELRLVPPKVARRPMPFRCTGCQEILKVYPFRRRLRVGPFPIGEVVNLAFEKSENTEQAS